MLSAGNNGTQLGCLCERKSAGERLLFTVCVWGGVAVLNNAVYIVAGKKKKNGGRGLECVEQKAGMGGFGDSLARLR